jgi:hypothetical protein
MDGTTKSQPVRLLSARTAVALAGVTLLQSAVACWALTEPLAWLPFSGLLPLSILPQTLCGVAMGLAAFMAPLMISQDETQSSWKQLLARDAFKAAWHAIVLGFVLMVCSRLVPLEAENVLRPLLLVTMSGLTFALLARVLPQAYPGIIFTWLVALPIVAYFFAEIFLSTPAGDRGWAESTGWAADAARTTMHWLLSVSPGTAAVGALNGYLADGTAYSTFASVLLFGGVTLILVLALVRQSGKDKGSAVSRERLEAGAQVNVHPVGRL